MRHRQAAPGSGGGQHTRRRRAGVSQPVAAYPQRYAQGRKRTRGQAGPLDLPTPLQTALEALYGYYEKTFKEWEADSTPCPPCFIVVCNNTATSKLVYDYISGFERTNEDGTTSVVNGRLALFGASMSTTIAIPFLAPC